MRHQESVLHTAQQLWELRKSLCAPSLADIFSALFQHTVGVLQIHCGSHDTHSPITAGACHSTQPQWWVHTNNSKTGQQCMMSTTQCLWLINTGWGCWYRWAVATSYQGC